MGIAGLLSYASILRKQSGRNSTRRLLLLIRLNYISSSATEDCTFRKRPAVFPVPGILPEPSPFPIERGHPCLLRLIKDSGSDTAWPPSLRHKKWNSSSMVLSGHSTSEASRLTVRKPRSRGDPCVKRDRSFSSTQMPASAIFPAMDMRKIMVERTLQSRHSSWCRAEQRQAFHTARHKLHICEQNNCLFFSVISFSVGTCHNETQTMALGLVAEVRRSLETLKPDNPWRSRCQQLKGSWEKCYWTLKERGQII